jgi:transposase IS66 family protein
MSPDQHDEGAGLAGDLLVGADAIKSYLVRRRFYELAAAGPAPIASEALERIAGLYAIENDIRGRDAEERRPSVRIGAGQLLMTSSPGCAPSLL